MSRRDGLNRTRAILMWWLILIVLGVALFIAWLRHLVRDRKNWSE